MFRMTQEGKDFFKNIINAGGSHGSEDKDKLLMFDPFYCCALIGLAAGQLDSSETGFTDIVQNYPQSYKEKRAQIAGLLIATEAKRTGIQLDSPKLENIMLKYLSSEEQTLLTDEGEKTLNAYARKGLALYQEIFPDPPKKREEFLMCFYNVLKAYKNDGLGD